MVPWKCWYCNPPLEDYLRSVKPKVDVVVISRMFGQKIKETEQSLGTIWEWAELHQSWISPGHWSCHWVHYCQGLTPPRRKARVFTLPGPGGGCCHSAEQCSAVCWFCIFAGDGSGEIISGLEARKYSARSALVILNTHQHTWEVNIIENIHLHIYLILQTAPLMFNNYSILSLGLWMLSVEQWTFKYERMRNVWEEEWIEKYSNKYLGQTILAKIFPLCRADVEAIFFLHQFQIQFSPIYWTNSPTAPKYWWWGFTRSVDTKHEFYH